MPGLNKKYKIELMCALAVVQVPIKLTPLVVTEVNYGYGLSLVNFRHSILYAL